jgi:cardiolipin synthase
MKTANKKTASLVIIIIGALLGACAGHETRLVDGHSDKVDDRRAMQNRASIAQGGVLLARSFQVDPINRPVSNAMSLGSYALKSTTGFLRRVAISTTQFPFLESKPVPELSYARGMDLAQWEEDLDRISGRQSSRGTIEFLIDGDEYFPRMLEAIRNAEETIHVRSYIFDNDDFAVSVADELKAKSDTVDVRVMYDGIGNLAALRANPESMPEDFIPPTSMERYLQHHSKVKVRELSNPWLTGDHTKTTIIDRKIAFTGGMNIGREYRYDWHDLMMEVRGPVVDQLQHDSNRAWAKASVFGDVAQFFALLSGREKNAEQTGYPVRTLYTRDFDSEIYQAQLAAIRRARSYIMIENSYFSDDATLYELAKARRRGVDVRVILPNRGNHSTHDTSNMIAMNRMLDNGIRVYRYPGMSHVKAAVIDGWASVGTANYDKLSLQVNKEVNLATSNTAAVSELLDRLFIPDLERSTEVREKFDITLQARIMEVVIDEVL